MKHVLKSSKIGLKMGWAAGLAIALAMVSVAGAQTDRHGRKWKPLPTLDHIVVTVVKGFDGKPLPNAAVVFHATLDGRDNGNLEVKTDPEGKATIDVIEVGSNVNVQVIAYGFSTYAQDINVSGPNKFLEVKLLRPREQVSQYENNSGKAAVVQPGIQEPPHPVLAKPKVGPDGYAIPQAASPAPKDASPAPQATPAPQPGSPQ
jgi:hypothetical protein